MQVTGFTIVRNAILYDYPIVECILSALPLVDEMVVAVGDSHDATLELVETIGSSKLRIIQTQWDDTVRRAGRVLAQQTNLAMKACVGDWYLYLQADEVLHEGDYEVIRRRMRDHWKRKSVEGLSFRYHHFRADYTIRDPLPYRRQVRIIRSGIGVESVGDACGFQLRGRTLRTTSSGAWVYHYGYVRPPKHMATKMDYFTSLYDGRSVVPGQERVGPEYHWNLDTCEPFAGSHPQVMRDRISSKNWETPAVVLRPRWRNPKYWWGMVHKNTRAVRRLAATASTLTRKAA